MFKKCVACGAPLDGIFAKVAALAGVKPSEKNPDYCNKCEAQIPSPTGSAPEKPPEPKETTPPASAPATAQAPAPEPPKPAEPEIKLNTEDPVDMFASTDKKDA